MRAWLVAVTLLSFGCAELRYPTRTEMVEVAPPPMQVVPRSEAVPVRVATPKDRRSGLLIGGGILATIGVAFIVGGAVGWSQQSAKNAAADADCEAQGGWFCGTFDGLSYAPFGGLIALGGMATVSSWVLFSLGARK
jgi:hypothetical protein